MCLNLQKSQYLIFLKIEEYKIFFEYVIYTVFQNKYTYFLYKALTNSGINNVWDLATIDTEDFGILQNRH